MAKSGALNLNYFREQWEMSRKMEEVLRYSYDRAGKIIPLVQQGLSPAADQAEILEALGARFARMSDMLVQKLFRAVDAQELVDEGSLVDRLNRMEKRLIIASAEEWIEIRQMRNQIAHDYVLKDLLSLYRSIYQRTPVLFNAIKALENYSKGKGWISD